MWWLRNNVPQGERKVSFVQGDTGPGQFMYADGQVTALIDWELAHIGDPMLDLAVGRMHPVIAGHIVPTRNALNFGGFILVEIEEDFSVHIAAHW